MKQKIFLILIALFMSLYSFADDVVFSENFSGSYPGAWTIGDYFNHGYSYGWAWPNGYAHEYTDPATGTQYYYHNNFDTYMRRSNIDLSGYTSANLSFYYVVDSEANYDFFEVWVKDSGGAWYRMLRESGPNDIAWRFKSIDISFIAGQNGVAIEFYFYSDGSIDGSDGDYAGAFLDGISLTAGPSASITVTSPNGGETWPVGSRRNITWDSQGDVENVKIEYSTNNGSSWSTAIASTPNDGSYSWTIPNAISAQCLVKVSDASDDNPSDTSDSVFSIVQGTTSITVTSPNGGESWGVGSTHDITWTSQGTVGKVKIELSTDNRSSWTTIVSSTNNDGTHSWTIPNTPSAECYVRINEASDGNPSDTSDSTFSITEDSGITVISPNGGESWGGNSTHPITWETSGNVGEVKIKLSTNNGGSWSTLVSSTDNDGIYDDWTVPNTPSTQCLVQICEVSNSSLCDTSNDVFSITPYSPPEIALNRTQFNFGASTNGTVTNPQTLLISNSGGGTLEWTAEDNVNWLVVSPASGTNDGIVTIIVNPSGLSTGIYSGTITVSAPNADNSPEYIYVILNVFTPGEDEPPFGSIETPPNNSTVMSSVPVTGWALDDIGVESLEIWRKSWETDPGGDGLWVHNYIGDAVFVEGARPDVEQSYPGYPFNYQAGWGYMLLTNFLPNNGNGTFTLYAKAIDKAGKEVILGERTIYCDNANAVKPFGAIDTPTPGGTVSGSSYRNQGWVLTPMPNKIPEDGSTIDVYVDGVYLGHPQYNIYRPDIAGFFPGYANSNGSLARLDFDTTAFSNGVHTIMWTAQDNAGNADGIGSRYFTIQNLGGTNRQISASSLQWWGSTGNASEIELLDIPVSFADPAFVIKGYTQDIEPQVILPDENGVIHIETRELERIVVQLFDNNSNDSALVGFLKVGDQFRALPIGSALDTGKAIFYWQPGPGFLGDYSLIFIDSKRNEMKKINVKILPLTLE